MLLLTQLPAIACALFVCVCTQRAAAFTCRQRRTGATKTGIYTLKKRYSSSRYSPVIVKHYHIAGVCAIYCCNHTSYDHCITSFTLAVAVSTFTRSTPAMA
jgi:hypothetical protein